MAVVNLRWSSYPSSGRSHNLYQGLSRKFRRLHGASLAEGPSVSGPPDPLFTCFDARLFGDAMLCLGVRALRRSAFQGIPKVVI